MKYTPRCGRVGSSECHENRGKSLEKRCEDLKLLRCLMRPSLRYEKQRCFLFSRIDLINRTDPDEVVRNVEYMM